MNKCPAFIEEKEKSGENINKKCNLGEEDAKGRKR